MTSPLSALYRSSLALATDLYQLTMAQAYWHAGVAEREAVFHLTFRREPFGGGYAIAAGTGLAIDYLAQAQLDDGDLAYLATIPGADGAPLFQPGFLDYLRGQRFTGTVDVVPEGALVFAHDCRQAMRLAFGIHVGQHICLKGGSVFGQVAGKAGAGQQKQGRRGNDGKAFSGVRRRVGTF